MIKYIMTLLTYSYKSEVKLNIKYKYTYGFIDVLDSENQPGSGSRALKLTEDV